MNGFDFGLFLGFFIDFADGEEAGVGEDVRAYDDGTDAETGGYVLGCWGWIFPASAGRFPDFWEMVALNP